jgi:hypothetical protein
MARASLDGKPDVIHRAIQRAFSLSKFSLLGAADGLPSRIPTTHHRIVGNEELLVSAREGENGMEVHSMPSIPNVSKNPWHSPFN